MSFSKGAFWRSLLFVPVDNPRFVEKAQGSKADAIILDLEDAVLPEKKSAARSLVRDAARSLKTEHRDIFVRINRPLAEAIGDIEASVSEHVDGLVVAKAASHDHLSLLGEVISECEAIRGLPIEHTQVIPLVETASAASALDHIVGAPRVAAIVCGDEDLAADLDCPPESETINAIKHRMVVAAARRGVRPLGLVGSITEFRNTDLYASFVERSRSAGLKGTLCIHPNQVEIANRGFAPSENEVSHARRVVEASQRAQFAGSGVVALDGKMIDLPVVLRAQKLLDCANRYANLAR